MTNKTLYLAWQSPTDPQQWYPIGRLEADDERGRYEFRYIRGAQRMMDESGREPYLGFPNLDQVYRAPELFAIFRNRVMNPRRPDFGNYLRGLGLGEDAGPLQMLEVNGGRRMTDTYQVFPKLIRDPGSRSTCRFFLEGWQNTGDDTRDRVNRLEPRETLGIHIGQDNPRTGPAVEPTARDSGTIGRAPNFLAQEIAGKMARGRRQVTGRTHRQGGTGEPPANPNVGIGRAPNFLAQEIAGKMAGAGAKSPGGHTARVVRVNPPPTPMSDRVLVEMHSHWGEYKPMNGPDYQPLVKPQT